jgi:predicted DNA-binding transcriptional regulator AlpA
MGMSGKLLLNSWKEIAAFVGRAERTLQRWEKQYGFPVHRPAGKARSAVVALISEIEAWTATTCAQVGAGQLGPASSEFLRRERLNREQDNLAATLLCVDTDPERLAARKRVLELGGYRVLTASKVRTALRLLHSNQVYVVILDYSVTESNGEPMPCFLQRHKPEVPVLILSRRRTYDFPEGIVNLIGALDNRRLPEQISV